MPVLARGAVALALVVLGGCALFTRHGRPGVSTLVIEMRRRGVVLAKVDDLPVTRDRGSLTTEHLPIDPGPHRIQLAYAHPASGPILQSGSAWGGGIAYEWPYVEIPLEVERGHAYRLAQEELPGGRLNGWIVDETTGETVAGPVQVWPRR